MINNATADGFKVLSNQKCFEGNLIRFEHTSRETKCTMTASLFLPPSCCAGTEASAQRVPVLYYLSGLTCTDENVIQKAGALRVAAETQVAFLAPDTSPRRVNIPSEDDSWDFGSGAGFYVDATQEPWATNYRMYSYVSVELEEVLQRHFPQVDTTRKGVTGHSMGGHGALTVALKNQHSFRSVSAFAPICHPIDSPWGVKAFSGYLGDNSEQREEAWAQYDACRLLQRAGKSTFDTILVDFGSADSFLSTQLKPHHLTQSCAEAGQALTLRLHEGYDHGYFFVSTFIEEHIRFHAQRLGATSS